MSQCRGTISGNSVGYLPRRACTDYQDIDLGGLHDSAIAYIGASMHRDLCPRDNCFWQRGSMCGA